MIYTDWSNEEYHDHPAISSTDVKMVASKTLHHWRGHVRVDKPAFDLGTAVHAMLLEPELDLVVRGPDSRRGKDWTETVAKNEGKTVLPSGEYDEAKKMADSVMRHKIAGNMLNAPDLLCEASFICIEPDIAISVKCRPDGLLRGSGVVFDIKTCQDASPRGFEKDLRNYGYDLQAAFYMHVLRLEGIHCPGFYFICVEKTAPYAVAIHTLSPEYLKHAHHRMMATLAQIAEAERTEEFTTGWPEINVIDLPAWMQAD